MVYKEDTVFKATLEYFKEDELAASIWMNKYALKNKTGEFLEKTPDDMHKRLAKEFARIEKSFGGKRALSFTTVYNTLKEFKYIVPQGSPMYGIGNNFSNVSLSNCVVVDSPEDSMSSIMDKGKELANLFKRRCGVGLDISKLRYDGALVNNSAGTTTGAWSFSDFYSYVCRMIGQKGRRGALMISMLVSHPDIFKFATMKNDTTKVTGANISIRLTDAFMSAVEQGEDFKLQWPVDAETPAFTKVIKARELWEVIVASATTSAEPGLMMWDNILKNLPANFYEEFQTLSTNPCGEVPLSSEDSCRLISVNLKNFVVNPFTETARFDFVKFQSVIEKAMRLSDDLVQLEIEKLENILKICSQKDERVMWSKLLAAASKGRRTGLGTHGLADVFARMCFSYGSDESLKLADNIYLAFKSHAYAESVRLSKERGPFSVFDWDKEKECAFIQRLPKALQAGIKKYGRRNISILTNAPTGSVSCVSQTSSGIEPVFRNAYVRRKKLSHNETGIEAEFVDDVGDRWLEYNVYHHNIGDYLDITGNSQDTLPEFFITSDKIDWQKRVELQGVIQNHIDHSISSTINLPKGTLPETVGQIYMAAWKRGLKGVTVYVDGSRSGVLIEKKKQLLRTSVPPERPDKLPCDIHQTIVRGTPWMVFVGMMENDVGEEIPYEVFAGEASKIKIPKKYDRGTVIKHARKTTRSVYDLVAGEGDDELNVFDIVDNFDDPNNATFTRTISLALRHGTPVKYIVEQLRKDEESDMFTFSKAVARVLKKYIKNGEKASSAGSDKVCPECGGESLVYNDGCVMCTSCGHSKCQ